MATGRLISLEGGEGCGKSTQVRLLAGRVQSLGRAVLTVREPGGTPLGERIRDLLKQDPAGRGMAAETELLLMNASRAELVRRVIRPALDAGTVVIADRFFDSTVAYQGSGRGLDPARVAAVVDVAVGGTRPDLTLWLRVPRGEAEGRLKSRSADGDVAEDRFEQESREFFDRVDSAYEALSGSEPERFVPVDGTGTPAEVSDRIWQRAARILLP